MKISLKNKKYCQISCLTVFILGMLFISIKPQLLIEEDFTGLTIKNYKAVPIIQYMLLVWAICLCILTDQSRMSEKMKKACSLFTLFIAPIISFIVFESIAGNLETILEQNKAIIILNLCIWYVLYAIVFALIGHTRSTIMFTSIVTYILALANAFVVEFRGDPIMPMDIKSIGTAASVAGEFTYELTFEMILMGLVIVLLNLWSATIDFSFSNWKIRGSYVMLTAAIVFCVGKGMIAGDWIEKAGVYGLDFWRFNESYKQNGYMLCTAKSLKYLQIEKPEGYSEENVKRIAENVKKRTAEKKDLPENVIVIMNESFADLSVLGEIETSESVMPFIDSMTENTTKGNCYVSVSGGGTANSEFEFLTGNSVAYIPNGTVAYQMYVEEGDSSIVSQMKKKGYHTITFHPFRKENYKRPKVYEIYGFDEYIGKGDMEYKNLREYPSDESDYKCIKKIHKQKKNGEKLFLFNVTIQNHSGYDYEKFKNTIELTGYPEKFAEEEQYLSLIHESDKAFENLIEYFSDIDEKTVILMFGDHQPALSEAFYEKIMGETTDENYFSNLEKKYITSYILWSNYDLGAKELGTTSLNYLGSWLMESIGIELPVYNQYLLNLQEKIPAINIFGYEDSDGTLHWSSEENEYSNLLKEYEMLQYNNLFDNKKRVAEIFD